MKGIRCRGKTIRIIERAHQHGIRVFGATLTPYQGADYFSEDGEATRQAVNQWIRSSGAFEGVIDFDLRCAILTG